MLFRNTRELLVNTVKPAQARKVTVAMTCRGNTLRIRVKDHGIGFDAQAIARRPGSQKTFGLFNIRERMSDLDGSLEIESEPGAGTTATLIVPLDRLIT